MRGSKQTCTSPKDRSDRKKSKTFVAKPGTIQEFSNTCLYFIVV